MVGHADEVADAADVLRTVCRSFSADTPVLMANGERKRIADVEVGDMVLATDPDTGETGAREVLATMPHADQLLILRTSSGEIVTTEDHKYWNATDEAWQESQDLDEGDRLLAADGDEVTVEGLAWSTVHTAPAYDLDIAGIDTFYVGAGDDSVLVHNAGSCPRFDGPKPSYHVNDAHVPGLLGFSPRKTPLPNDAQSVYRNAVPDDPANPRHWYGVNEDGAIYRFSDSNNGTAHFSGRSDVGDGLPNISAYALERLGR